MPPLLREHPDELAALIAAAATQLGLDQSYVEKDFWAMEVLRACTAPVEITGPNGNGSVTAIFKGGTSLSRAYGLIERFSEDIDLLIVFPDVGAGKGAKDKVLIKLRDTVSRHLGLPDVAVVPKESTTGVKRNVSYHYPAQTTALPIAVDAISQGVLLEMGTRGGAFPTHRHQIRSLLANFAIDHFGDTTETWAEFVPFEVEVLAPERTLFEKLAALHDGASRAPDEAAVASLHRNARHLYDIHRLLWDEQVVATLTALGADGIAQLCADIDEHSTTAGFSHTPRPAEGFAASPLLTDDHPSRPALEVGYQRAMHLVYGAQPSMQDCLDTIRMHAHVL